MWPYSLCGHGMSPKRVIHANDKTVEKHLNDTVIHNHHHLRHSQLVGLARKQYSNRLAWSPRVSLLPWRTLRSSMMNPVFQRSTCMVKPKPEPLASSSISLYLLIWNLFFLFPSFFFVYAYLCLLVLLGYTCGIWAHLQWFGHNLLTSILRKASSTKYRKVAPSSTRYSKVVLNTLK